MHRKFFLDSSSTESDVFCVERSSEEGSPVRNDTPAVLNCTHLSGPRARETITISSDASQEQKIVRIETDSNESLIPNAFGNQHANVPPRLNDLNLRPNTFNLLAAMVVIQPDEDYGPESPEQSHMSPISTPPWISVPWKAGRHHSQLQMKIQFLRG